MQLRQVPEIGRPFQPLDHPCQPSHRNIIFAQADDHRFDMLGTLSHKTRPDDKFAY